MTSQNLSAKNFSRTVFFVSHNRITQLFRNFAAHKKPTTMIRESVAKRMTGILLLLIFMAGGIYTARDLLLRRLAHRYVSHIEQRYGIVTRYDRLHLHSISRITLQGLSVVPQRHDTLLTLQRLDLYIDPWKVLTGDIDVTRMDVDSLSVRFVKQGTTANYDCLSAHSGRPSARQASEEKDHTDYSRRVQAVLELMFKLLPGNGELRGIRVSEQTDAHTGSIYLPRLKLKEHRFQSEMSIDEDSDLQQWSVRGELNPKRRLAAFSLSACSHEVVRLPYIQRQFGLEMTFDSLSCRFTQQDRYNRQTTLEGQMQVNGLQIRHRRLSTNTINLNHGETEFYLNIGPHVIELDSSSLVRFNALTFHPYLRLEHRQDTARPSREAVAWQLPWHCLLSVNKPRFPAQELFGSLPQGLFSNLEGIETAGELSYRLLLDVDFSRIDSLKLVSELKGEHFRINHYGTSDLGKMSDEFEYTAYENDVPVRTFPVGPSWEQFMPLDSIPLLLQTAVMQSEDGGFFHHRGFLPDALREALIHDIKVGRFARGGSTISMQLVKNVFLNHNKNIARKLEEALIVWLIENQRLTSKERMYEVYLNIAEWGPMIYGIREAARFYFDKCPSQLTADECICLASLIPRPKHFRSLFTEEGQLKENQDGYFRLMAGRLVAKGLISEDEASRISPGNVILNGAAKEYVLQMPPQRRLEEVEPDDRRDEPAEPAELFPADRREEEDVPLSTLPPVRVCTEEDVLRVRCCPETSGLEEFCGRVAEGAVC